MPVRKGLFKLSIIIFSIWLILIILNKGKASFQELALASAIYFFGCLPSLIYLGRKEKNIPYLLIFGAFYFVYFSLSVFINYDTLLTAHIASQTIIKCLKLALWGIISLMVAFYTPMGKMIDLMVIPLKMPWDPRKAFRIGVFLGLVGIITHYNYFSIVISSAYVGPLHFIINLSRLGIAILFLLQLQNRLNLGSKIFLWLGLFIPRVMLDLIGGAIFPVIVDFILLFFLYFYYFRYFPWVKIIMAGIIFFVVFSARDEFRGLVWYGKYGALRPQEKIGLYAKLIYKSLTGEREKYLETAYDKLSTRTDNLITFSRVVEMTPDRVPYWGGYTYAALFTTLIPRFLMPEKHLKMLGQEFGHRYMLLSPRDVSTSYNLPILIEMYINFGPPAIIIGMFILGLIFRVFYDLFNHPAAGDGGFLLSTMIFINLLNIESDFSLIFGNIVQYMILFYIIYKTIRMHIERIR